MKWKSQTHSAFGNFSNLETFPGISTLFLKLIEDDNLTGLQTNIKKPFHMLISKITTKHCGTICHSKISSLGELFLVLVQILNSFELLTLFFSTKIDHLNGLQTIVKLRTYCLRVAVLSKRIRDLQHILNIESPALAQLSTIPHNWMKLQNWILFTKMSPTVHFGTIWLN